VNHSGRLSGLGVLVTRPEQQAAALCDMLAAEGAEAVRLPAIDIIPAGDQRKLVRLESGPPFDFLIFTSANAVRFGHAAIPPGCGAKIAAIGPATARALAQSGHPVALTPGADFDSESLLRSPELEHLDGRRALIIKGEGGRELLQAELARRGAEVVTAEVYRRARTVHDPGRLASIAARLRAGEIHIVTATSTEIGETLLAMPQPALRREFGRVHWLVPGARVAAALRKRGLEAPVVQADSAEDQDLLAAIIRWRSSVSGA
jgi:uroporphyrinogen-III synthase